MLARRLAGGQVAKIECLPARCIRLRTPPIPVVDDGLHREKMSSRCGKWRRQRHVDCPCIKAPRQEIFPLSRPRTAGGAVLVKTHVHTLEIDGAPNEATSKNAIDV